MRGLVAFLGLALGAWLAGPARAAEPDVSGYHADPARTGRYIVPGLTFARAATAHLDPAFDGHVPGHVYAQPLYWRRPGAAHGIIVVATEDNQVLALDAATGAQVWRHDLGAVVPVRALPCGDINPLGVTGTPVIDAPAGVIYLDSFEYGSGAPRHVLHALSLRDGAPLPGWPLDVAALLAGAGRKFDPTVQNQRGALALVSHELLVPFGGQSGDCGDYHGWVVGIDVARHALAAAWESRAHGGSVWGQGGVTYDGGSIFVATGNTFGPATWGEGEAVLRLPADLRHPTDTHDFFAPANWRTLDQYDLDLGSTAPLSLDLPALGGPQPVILQMGKDGDAYVLDRTDLGGIGRARVTRHVVQGRITTGPAAFPLAGGVGVALYAVGTATECPHPVANANFLVLRLAAGHPVRVTTEWCAWLPGRGAPIVTMSGDHADAVVWVMGAEGDERLHGYRADTGDVVFAGGGEADRVPRVRHFATPIAAEGRLYVAGDGRISAFAFAGN